MTDRPAEIRAALRAEGVTVHSAAADPGDPCRVVVWLEGYRAQSGEALVLASGLPGGRSARLADGDRPSPVCLVLALDP